MKHIDELFAPGEILSGQLDGKQLTEEEVRGLPDFQISGIAYDSRTAGPGDLFCAIRGYETDGHRFIPQAVGSGVTAVLCEEIPEGNFPGVLFIRAENTRHLLGPAAARFYDMPCDSMTTVGVTGTNGKTSITSLTRDIFAKAGYKAGLIGTIHNMIGDEILDNKGRTTPESSDMQALLAHMRDQGCSFVAAEGSSHALYLDRLNGTRFDYSIFTNLTQDHIDFHKTMEDYYQAKKKLFAMTRRADIINIDDEHGRRLYGELQNGPLPVYSYGFSPEADFQTKDLDLSLQGTEFTIGRKDGDIRIFTPVIGDFMAVNATAAAAAALLEGIDAETIREALAEPSEITGRMDLVKTGAPFEVIIDYAHSPDSLEKLLQTVKDIHPDGKVVVVFGANGDRDKAKRPMMGRAAGANADFVVVTSDNPASEEPQAIIDAVVEGVREKTDRYETVIRRQDGIRRAAELCEPGDVLVCAGKGHELQEILQDGYHPYSEWDTVREAVRSLGWEA